MKIAENAEYQHIANWTEALRNRGEAAAEKHFNEFGYHTLAGAKSAFGKAFNKRMLQLLNQYSTFWEPFID